MDLISILTLIFSIITPILVIVFSNLLNGRMRAYELKNDEITQLERSIQSAEETMVQSLFVPSDLDNFEKHNELYKQIFQQIMDNVNKVVEYQKTIRRIIVSNTLK